MNVLEIITSKINNTKIAAVDVPIPPAKPPICNSSFFHLYNSLCSKSITVRALWQTYQMDTSYYGNMNSTLLPSGYSSS